MADHPETLTVGALRKAIEGLSDETEVVVRVTMDDGHDYCGSGEVSVQHTCGGDDTPYLAIDCMEDDDA